MSYGKGNALKWIETLNTPHFVYYINLLYIFRKKLLGLPEKPENAGSFDLVVVGAGTAGLSAAIKASREGLKVALIHNRPVPGGNNSVEIRVVASGDIQVHPYPKLGDVTKLPHA